MLNPALPLLALALCSPAAGVEWDVRSFGAICNSTADDAVAVQSALNRMGAGDTLLIPCRAGIGRAGLSIRDRSDITIRGVNGGGFKALAPTTLAAQGFSPVMILVERCTRCAVESLDIEMNGVGEAAIGFDRCSESSLRNNTVTDTAYPANAAIVATGNRQGLYIGNHVLRTGSSATDGTRGMWIGNGSDAQEEWRPEVANNQVENTGATGIVVYARGGAVTGNSVSFSKGAGLKLSLRALPDAPPGPQTRIEENTLTGNMFHGIQIERGEGGVLIARNTLDSNAIAGLYVHGGAFSGEIAGNTFTGNREAGIYLYAAAGLAIRNNRLDAGSPSQGHGILIEAMADSSLLEIEISGNTIWDQRWDGIAVRMRGGSLAGLRVEANSIGGRSPAGVRIEDASGRTAGQIVLGLNCFDRQLTRTLTDTRTAPLPVPAAADCKGGRPE